MTDKELKWFKIMNRNHFLDSEILRARARHLCKNDSLIEKGLQHILNNVKGKKTMNKIMTIETEKIMSEGHQLRKILKINNCKEYKDLPLLYLNGPHVYLNVEYTWFETKTRIINGRDNRELLLEGVTYHEKSFQDKIKYIRECGKRLARINKNIKNCWKDKETFEI